MRRDDGNSYTTEIEAIDMANECVEFAKERGIKTHGFVQKRGERNYMVTPVEYSSYKTVYVAI